MSKSLLIGGGLIILLAALSPLMVTGMEIVTSTTPVPQAGTEGGPAFPLSAAELDMWISGRRIFDRDFHLSDGLGAPEFNGDSCRACHQDPVVGGSGGLDNNVSRFARDNGGMGPFENLPGGQIAHRFYRPQTLGREEIPDTADVFEQRQSPSILGLGLIETVPASEILAYADPNDLNGDGISGTARWVSVGSGTPELGRFGWKANIPSLEDFAKDALAAELGITVRNASRGFGLTSDNDGLADPEISDSDVADLTFFMRNLAAPPRGGSSNPLVAVGESLFTTVGCAACHVPTLQSAHGPISPYSDFLLHEIMPTGFRAMEEPDAPVGSYRTPPLWGISRTGPYMHDGSAESLFDSIQAHDGEAATSRANFMALPSGDQQALLLFLEDL